MLHPLDVAAFAVASQAANTAMAGWGHSNRGAMSVDTPQLNRKISVLGLQHEGHYARLHALAEPPHVFCVLHPQDVAAAAVASQATAGRGRSKKGAMAADVPLLSPEELAMSCQLASVLEMMDSLSGECAARHKQWMAYGACTGGLPRLPARCGIQRRR